MSTPLPPIRIVERSSTAARRRPWFRRPLVLVVALAVLAAGGWVSAQELTRQAREATRYSTVSPTRGSVTQVLRAQGTVARVNSDASRFPVAGTVTEVRAQVGDTVRAGDVLAVMDDRELRAAVLQAQAAADAATLALRQARDAEKATATPRSSGAGAAATAPSLPASTTDVPSAAPVAPVPVLDLAPLGAAQAAAAAASGRAIEAAARADAAMAAVRVACSISPSPSGSPTPSTPPGATPGSSPSGSPSPSATPSHGTPSPSVTPTGTPSGQPHPEPGQRQCLEALSAAAAAQAQLAGAQAAQQQAAAGWLALLAAGSQALAAATSVTAATSITGAPCVAPAAVTAPAQLSGAVPMEAAATGGSSSVTSAKVANDKAQRQLARARDDLAAATLRAPIDGVLGALPFQVGQHVTQAEEAIVVGPGSIKVTVQIPESAFLSVAPGQQATVRAPGIPEVQAVVVTKSLVPSSTGDYPVEVVASGSGADAYSGGVSASVAIVVDAATDVLVVPLSAVSRNGNTGTVRKLVGTEVATVPVKLGTVGENTIVVTEGVAEGDRLVVADRDRPLPSLDLTTGRTTTNEGESGGEGTASEPTAAASEKPR